MVEFYRTRVANRILLALFLFECQILLDIYYFQIIIRVVNPI